MPGSSFACPAWLLLALAGCKTSEPPMMTRAPEPQFRDGIRQEPLTVTEAEDLVKKNRPRIEACYLREGANSPKLSSYKVRLRIPADGKRPEATVVEHSMPEQTVLEDCVVGTLRAIRFPAHVGSTIELEIPIEM